MDEIHRPTGTNTKNKTISKKDLNYLLGKRGAASTDLRPAGRVNFDGVEFNVISEGKFSL